MTKGPTFIVHGRPLSEIGLENAVIRLKSGTIVPLAGVAVYHGQALHEAVEASLPEGASLFLSLEDAQAHCDHNWLEHFGPHGPTHRMCLTCGKEEMLLGWPEHGHTAVEEAPMKKRLGIKNATWLGEPTFTDRYGWIIIIVMLGLIVSMFLAGCATTEDDYWGRVSTACETCIGPYDLMLSSHREGLGIE